MIGWAPMPAGPAAGAATTDGTFTAASGGGRPIAEPSPGILLRATTAPPSGPPPAVSLVPAGEPWPVPFCGAAAIFGRAICGPSTPTGPTPAPAPATGGRAATGPVATARGPAEGAAATADAPAGPAVGTAALGPGATFARGAPASVGVLSTFRADATASAAGGA